MPRVKPLARVAPRRRGSSLDAAAPSLVLEQRAGDRARVEDLLARRFDEAPEPVFGLDLEGRLSYLNPSFCALVEVPREELLGNPPPYPFVAPESRSAAMDLHWQGVDGRVAAAGIEAVRLRFRSSEGATFPVLMTGGPIHFGGRAVGLIGFVHDLREVSRDPKLAGERLIRRTRLYQEYERSQRALDPLEANSGDERAPNCVICRVIGQDRVSAREHDVLVAFVENQDSSVLAERLGISTHTLRNHLKSIFRKLGVRSRLDLYKLLFAWPTWAIVILAQIPDTG